MGKPRAPKPLALGIAAFVLGTIAFVLGVTIVSAILWSITSFGIFPPVIDMYQAQITCYSLAANALAWAAYEKIDPETFTKRRFAFTGWVIFLNLCALPLVPVQIFGDTLWYLGLGIGGNIYMLYHTVSEHEKELNRELKSLKSEYATLKETFDALPVHRPLGPGETIIDLILEELGPPEKAPPVTVARDGSSPAQPDLSGLHEYFDRTYGQPQQAVLGADYRVERRLRPVLGEYTKVTKEVTLGFWGEEHRLDIRKWEAGKLGKGISLTADEVQRLRSVLKNTDFGK